MTSLTGRNIRMALQSIKGTKTRSILTMTGIIIGVASVITAVSLGEGVRQQLAGTVNNSGKNYITVRPGRLVKRDKNDNIASVNYLGALGADTITDQDLQSVAKLPSIQSVVPLSTISALATTKDGRTYDASIIGTTSDFAVIGKTVAEQLFQENVPLGHSVMLRGHEFIVTGILDDFRSSTFTNGSSINNAIFIPYQVAKDISSNTTHIYQLLIEPKADSSSVVNDVSSTITANHGGQADFTVLTKTETLQLTSKALSFLTEFIAGIAAISLIVGGIGIMNIMFVGVTERTREIGVRKSLGATNRQIYNQFLIEATILSVTGGIIGVILALLADFFIKVLTNLHPVATLPIIGIAVIISSAVGIIFGTAPAVKAARKDPIESLRYE
jgi:putative ABC transport system permease protein